MDRKKVLLQAIESGFEVTSEGIPCTTECAKEGYALDYVIEGNDGGVGDLTGNLFNYTEPTGQIQADQDGWFDITIDNSTGTSTKYANCRTKVNSSLKTGTSYYVYYEVAEKSGDLNVWVTEGSPVKGDSGQFTSSLGNKSGFNTTRDSFDECKSMTRTTVTCAAGKSGHIKFRIGVYETKQDQFMYNQYKIPIVNGDKTVTILLNAPIKSGESIRYTSDNLPALPLRENVNSITVNTAVQPTNLAVTYRAKVK